MDYSKLPIFAEADIVVCGGGTAGAFAAKAAAESDFAARLQTFTEARKLFYLPGPTESPFADEIWGRTYRLRENPMGIREFTFRFTESGGELRYVNAQGEKVLPFGLGKNVFCQFPQLGYSDLLAGVHDESSDFKYAAAVSAGWVEEAKLNLRVQIIDKYFGNMTAEFAFRGDQAAVRMRKTAEDFLEEYQGTLLAEKA